MSGLCVALGGGRGGDGVTTEWRCEAGDSACTSCSGRAGMGTAVPSRESTPPVQGAGSEVHLEPSKAPWFAGPVQSVPGPFAYPCL